MYCYIFWNISEVLPAAAPVVFWLWPACPVAWPASCHVCSCLPPPPCPCWPPGRPAGLPSAAWGRPRSSAPWSGRTGARRERGPPGNTRRRCRQSSGPSWCCLYTLAALSRVFLTDDRPTGKDGSGRRRLYPLRLLLLKTLVNQSSSKNHFHFKLFQLVPKKTGQVTLSQLLVSTSFDAESNPTFIYLSFFLCSASSVQQRR